MHARRCAQASRHGYRVDRSAKQSTQRPRFHLLSACLRAQNLASKTCTSPTTPRAPPSSTSTRDAISHCPVIGPLQSPATPGIPAVALHGWIAIAALRVPGTPPHLCPFCRCCPAHRTTRWLPPCAVRSACVQPGHAICPRLFQTGIVRLCAPAGSGPPSCPPRIGARRCRRPPTGFISANRDCCRKRVNWFAPMNSPPECRRVRDEDLLNSQGASHGNCQEARRQKSG